jgi:hypothetical protein
MSEFLIERDNEQNEVVKKWASMVQTRLRANAGAMSNGKDSFVMRGEVREKKLADSIVARTRTINGVISNVSFSFERHGIFVHKGVGNGYSIKSGMVTRTAKGEPMNRHPKEWFNPPIDQTLPELADKLAEINADATLSLTRILIK